MTHGTASEMAAARHWAAMFDAGEPPFSFLFGNRAAGDLIQAWPCERVIATGGLRADGTHRELP